MVERAHDGRTLLSDEAAELLGTPPPRGLRRALGGVLGLVAAALAWGLLGRVESTVGGRGVLAVESRHRAGPEPRALALLHLPTALAARVAVGQRARVRIGRGAGPGGAVVVDGTVAAVEPPLADAELGVVTPVVVELTGPLAFTVVADVPVAGDVVTGEVAPLAWLLGRGL